MRIITFVLLALMIMSPTVALFPKPPQISAEMQSARRALESARNDVEHAGGGWGGHMAEAKKHIDEALRELGEAEKWAREHHEIK